MKVLLKCTQEACPDRHPRQLQPRPAEIWSGKSSCLHNEHLWIDCLNSCDSIRKQLCSLGGNSVGYIVLSEGDLRSQREDFLKKSAIDAVDLHQSSKATALLTSIEQKAHRLIVANNQGRFWKLPVTTGNSHYLLHPVSFLHLSFLFQSTCSVAAACSSWPLWPASPEPSTCSSSCLKICNDGYIDILRDH